MDRSSIGRDGAMPHWPQAIDRDEAVWIRRQVHRRGPVRGIYRALTEVLNIQRFMAGRPPVRKASVYAAAVGNTWKGLEEPPVTPDPHLRPNKLTRGKVREIVQLLDQKEPKLTTVEIARIFKVSQVAVTKINLGQIHAWATRGQSKAKRTRHKEVKLSAEDARCMISCAADKEWWTYDLLAEIFGMTSGQAVMQRLRAARRRQAQGLTASGSRRRAR